MKPRKDIEILWGRYGTRSVGHGELSWFMIYSRLYAPGSMLIMTAKRNDLMTINDAETIRKAKHADSNASGIRKASRWRPTHLF